MEEIEKQLRVKVEERNMICAENKELKKKVECEEKCWDLNAVIGTKWKEHKAFQLECNQAIR
ncbi:hypothetical protein Tco_1170394, partial [Tanacetum coccineum]